jgi:hypothetical protein
MNPASSMQQALKRLKTQVEVKIFTRRQTNQTPFYVIHGITTCKITKRKDP